LNLLKKYLIGLILLILILFASYLIYDYLHPKKLPPNLIEGVGRIDGDLVNINTKYPGRIEKIFIQDSSKIKKNDLIAILSSKEYEAKKEGLNALIEAKTKEIKAKEIELEITKDSLPQNVKKALEDVKAKEAAINELNKNIDTLKDIVSQDKKDLNRLKALYKNNLIEKHKIEEAQLKYKSDKNRLLSLIEKKKRLKSYINISKSSLKQAKTTLKKIKSLKFAIEGLKNSLLALKAQRKEIDAILDELKIRSFIDGYIVEKIAQEGEVITPQIPIATAIDPKSLYLKIFIDTINVGKIKIGNDAIIFLDAYPNKPIKAKVVRIAQKAEFTPKEVAVRSDRIQRVYAVDIKPIKPNPLLKLGLPAIGIISIDGKNLPKSLKDIPQI